MTITPTLLTRAAGLSAVAAGLLFIGVQVGHPYLDATTVTTTGVGTTNGFTTISCPGRPDIAAGTTVTIPSLAPGQEIRCQASGVL